MSKRARGVKKGVHNIAFCVRYAFGRTLHSGAFFLCSLFAVMCIPGQWVCSLWVSGRNAFGQWMSCAQSVSVFEPTSNLLVVLWAIPWPLTAFLRSFCCNVYSRSLDL